MLCTAIFSILIGAAAFYIAGVATIKEYELLPPAWAAIILGIFFGYVAIKDSRVSGINSVQQWIRGLFLTCKKVIYFIRFFAVRQKTVFSLLTKN